MKGRIWILAALVAAALALHLVMLSAKVGQTGEDNVRAHLALSTSALRAQLELLDARLPPRAVASVPELIELTRAPSDPAEPMAKPGDRALRAAASVLSPEPDLLAVVTRQGAILSRRARPAQFLDDVGQIPLARGALEGNPAPMFASFDGALYRLAAARVPGNGAAVVVGTLIDDHFAAQLRGQVDADVTLVQGGKLLASSLPQGNPRAAVLRWTAAPAPGYGVLPVILPGIGEALTGKLPRGVAQYAVRAALVPIDSGVQAALTVPAGPYLGWLGRYQAYYLLALALFLLFSLIWGLLARSPRPALPVPTGVEKPAIDETASAPRPARTPAPLLGTDVGEPRPTPPPTSDVPWPAGEQIETPPQPAPAVESLDPDLPPGEPAKGEAPSVNAPDHPMWSADPFTPTPAHLEEEPQAVSPAEVGLVEVAPEPAPGSSAAKGDFSFAGLLDEKGATRQAQAEQPAPADGARQPFPGDEPTRIEPVSAALLDKMRERDEGPAAGEGDLDRTSESPPPQMEAPPASEANVTLQDFSLPAVNEQDPDEAHWRETYDRFRELKTRLGEPADRISFEKFAGKLRKNRADIVAKHNCKGVRFSVYEKDGKAAIKASAIR